jgi:NAD(P)H-nitrite reductase large subunit
MNLERVEERDGSLVCVCDKKEATGDILGVGIGATPDLSWVTEAGIETNRGILVNEFLQTNEPDIFAAGDAAEYFDVIAGRHILFGNWMKAMSQGRVAAQNMSGQKNSFRQVTTYATSVLGLDVSFVGDTEAAKADQIVLRKGEEGVTQIHVRDGRVVGAVVVGRNQDRMPLTKIIDSQEDVSAKLKSWEDVKNPLS